MTRDGSNYMFSASDHPGIVYLPKEGDLPPVAMITRKRTGRLNTWFGLVGQGGTQFVVVIVFDVPFGGFGVEASAYFGVSSFNAVWDNL